MDVNFMYVDTFITQPRHFVTNLITCIAYHLLHLSLPLAQSFCCQDKYVFSILFPFRLHSEMERNVCYYIMFNKSTYFLPDVALNIDCIGILIIVLFDV